jgi:hypothetical protein
VITLRPGGADRPETTATRFSVRSRFDDGTIGDLTHHADLEWAPSANVNNRGFLIVADGNGPGTPEVAVEARLPLNLQDATTPGRHTATGRIRFAADWAMESSILTSTVQVQDAWPGTINPEVVPNFLFLCDGYTTNDEPAFEAQVRSLLSLMKRSQITRPFDLLSTSMNYFQAFVPSGQHGVSVLCEVYPEQTANGAPDIRQDQTVDVLCVPDGEDPSAGRTWGLSHVIARLGLPVPSQGLARPVREVRDYWDQIADGVPQERISDKTVRRWQKLALRTFLEEPDSTLGLAYGRYPRAARETDTRMLDFHPYRMSRTRLDRLLGRLVDQHGRRLGPLWMERADGTRPNSHPLVFLLTSLKWDRGVNYGRGFIAMNVEDRDAIPVRAIQGRPTYAIDLTTRITTRLSHGRLIRGCHEVAHSFGLGDEYSETGTMPASLDIDDEYGNLQKHADVEDDLHYINGDLIKWRWHRVRKAAVILGTIAEVQPGRFRVPVVLGQAAQFAVGNEVMLRIRRFPNPLPRLNVDDNVGPRDPGVSHLLEIVGIADPDGLQDPSRPAGADNPPAAAVFVSPIEGEPFTAADAARFGAGCIVYLPVPASELVISPDYPYSELIAKNIRDHITERNRALNQVPDGDDACVPDHDGIQSPVHFDVDLPICFSHKNRIVGLYTGGATYDCGVYHPTGSCIMRSSNSEGREFCAVCRYLLVDIIDPSKHFSIDLDYEKVYPQK